MFPISIIIPSYNRAALVDKTLHSLTRQSRKDFQTILVDHGSSDHTEEISRKYKDQLHLVYYKMVRESYSPGAPRDFGMKKAETPLIAFVDSGTVVPSNYVEAHLAFHHNHSNTVGIGLQYKNDAADESFVSVLNQGDIDQTYALLKDAQFQDERAEIDLATTTFPWYWGWTANLSLNREAYFAAGGFDLELEGWGFEDVDLCYKLSRLGLRFALVEEAWSLEVPQYRAPIRERAQSLQKNMLFCYGKHRSLALEAFCLTRMLVWKAIGVYRSQPNANMGILANPELAKKMNSNQYVEQVEEQFRFLTALGQQRVAHPLPPDQLRAQSTGPTLLIGGTPQDAAWCDYVTLLNPEGVSTPALWSCCGVLIPMGDHTLETVIVSDIWKKLDLTYDHPLGIAPVSLLEMLLSEIQRTARQAVFLDAPSSAASDVTVETLEQMCQRYHFTYRVVAPAYVS